NILFMRKRINFGASLQTAACRHKTSLYSPENTGRRGEQNRPAAFIRACRIIGYAFGQTTLGDPLEIQAFVFTEPHTTEAVSIHQKQRGLIRHQEEFGTVDRQ